MTLYTAKTNATWQQQYEKVAAYQFTFADVVAAGAGFYPAFIELPLGALVTGGALVVTTAFNAGTSLTAEIGTSGTPAAVLVATSIQTAGATQITLPFNPTTAAAQLGLTFALSGAAPTAGAAICYVRYINPTGADFVVGNNLSPNL